MHVGIDVGGTFTDFVAFHPQRGWLQRKQPTSRPDPSVGILQGLAELDLGPGTLSHGTTAATNVALERKGPRTALITTRGFADLLELGRGQRSDLYALQAQPRPTLVPRTFCWEVNERLSADGHVLTALAREECQQLAHQLLRAGVEAVAICLLFSYRNPRHELLLAEVLQEHGLSTSLSHQVDPQPKEYERASTTVMRAYVAPSLEHYLGRLQQNLPQLDLWVVRSRGSVARPQEAVEQAVGCLLSGPAAGLQGAWQLAQSLGIERLMTLDVGGTSSDVALCDGGLPFLEESQLEGLPFRCPQVDIHTIGAGGGSIASHDRAGLLQVGPRSAGSQPGPAAYGRGGPPTLTDALLALGRLPQQLAGGQLGLNQEASQQALEGLARELGLPLLELAAAIVELAEHHMAQALRLISLERGHDARRFTLMAFGGAGGSHGANLATQLGIRRVVIPPHPGLLCAQGAMLAPWQAERRASWNRPLLEILPAVQQWFQSQRRELGKAAPPGTVAWERNYELRYPGQGSSLWVTTPRASGFHRLHRRRFGYDRPDQPLELVSTLLSASVQRDPVPLSPASQAPARLQGQALACWGLPPRQGPIQVWEGYPQEWVEGPACLERADGTTWVPPRWRAQRGPFGALIMESLFEEEEHGE